MLRVFLSIIFLLPTLVYAENNINSNNYVAPVTKNISHVIYVTLDGTRWQDVYGSNSVFSKLWKYYAKEGVFYGAPESNTEMQVDSIPVSLPSYQCQMSGHVTPCDNNWCGRIQETTLPENILQNLHLEKSQVATFSSWNNIKWAAESVEGFTYVNAGNLPVVDPYTGQPDEIMAKINYQQEIDNPNEELNRWDKYTFDQAMNYYTKHRPTFLWLSFNDADEAAHSGNLIAYYQALTLYDNALDTLFKMLKEKDWEKDTLIIVTTDHGRGNDLHWTSHGPEYPESRQTWAFVINGELQPLEQREDKTIYGTTSIRPTIEKALGITVRTV